MKLTSPGDDASPPPGRRQRPLRDLLVTLSCAAAVGTSDLAQARRVDHEGREAINMAREARKAGIGLGRPAEVPKGRVEVAATGRRQWPGDLGAARAALTQSAAAHGLRVVGPVEIPTDDLTRLGTTSAAASRVWLCGDDEPGLGPCLISMTVLERRDTPGKIRASFRVWSLSGVTTRALERAAERAEAVLRGLGS